MCGGPDAGEGPAVVICRRTATDLRLAGTLTSEDATGTGNDPDLFIDWRTFTMSNEGGGWTCKRLTIGREASAGWADEICKGEDGYAGLTAYIHAISGNNATDFGVLGWVEEAP